MPLAGGIAQLRVLISGKAHAGRRNRHGGGIYTLTCLVIFAVGNIVRLRYC